jgi:methylthioribose-1-phosphate isomerase
MGALGAALLPDPARVLTHCNAGGLATTGYGTAVGVLRAAHTGGKRLHVWVDETRPVLQGARLTAWEMLQAGIPHTVIPDVAAGALMQRGEVDAVIVGADRVAANGDVANKIGTYSLAVLANAHQIPFYVAVPISTIDLSVPSGDAIPIEERAPDEVRQVGGVAIVPAASPVLNLAFDVTPHQLVSAIITEAGVVRPPYAEAIRSLVGAARRCEVA